MPWMQIKGFFREKAVSKFEGFLFLCTSIAVHNIATSSPHR